MYVHEEKTDKAEDAIPWGGSKGFKEGLSS